MIGTWPRRSRPAPSRLTAPGIAPAWAGPLRFQPPAPGETPRNCCGTDVTVFGHTLCPLAPPPPGDWREREPQP